MELISRNMKLTTTTTFTSSVAETTISPAVISGVYMDLYRLVLSNSSATGSLVSLRSETGGTVIANIWVPATGTVVIGGRGSDALPQAKPGVLWTAQCGTSVASVYVNAEWIKNYA